MVFPVNMDELNEDSKKHNIREVPFEEALDLAGLGQYTYTLFAVSIFSFLCGSIEFFSVSLITVSGQCDLHLNVYKKSMIASVPMLGIVVSAHLWGYLADTRGRKRCLMLSMAGNFVFAYAASFANNWIFLAFCKFFSTACSSGTHSVTATMLGEMTPACYRTRFLQFVGVAIMSQSISVTLAYLIQILDVEVIIPYIYIDYCPWRMLTQGLAMFALINLVIVKMFIFESPKYYFSSGDETQGLEILRKIYSKNTGHCPYQYIPRKVVLDEDSNVKETHVNMFVTAWRQTVPLFGKKYLKSTLLISYVTIVVYSLSSPFIIWLPLILEHYSENMDTSNSFCQVIEDKAAARIERDRNTTTVTECHDKFHSFTLLAIGGVSFYYCLATMFSVYIIKYTGRKWLLVGTHVICSSMLVLVNFIPNVGAVFVFMGALSTLVCMGVCAAYAVDLFPTYFRAMAVCLTIMMGRGFSFVTISLIGPELEKNCSSFMYIVAAFMFSGAIAGFFLPEPKKPVKSPVIIITETNGVDIVESQFDST